MSSHPFLLKINMKSSSSSDLTLESHIIKSRIGEFKAALEVILLFRHVKKCLVLFQYDFMYFQAYDRILNSLMQQTIYFSIQHIFHEDLLCSKHCAGN